MRLLAVVFSAELRADAAPGYAKAAARVRRLAERMPGFVGVESAQQGAREVTVSYWETRAALAAWRDHPEHRAMQERGRREWYAQYEVRVARVERTRSWTR